MKKLLQFLAMAACCLVTAMALIYVVTADPDATKANLAWVAAGTVSFLLAVAVNPFRERESIGERERCEAKRS